jgi:hypothetical protein
MVRREKARAWIQKRARIRHSKRSRSVHTSGLLVKHVRFSLSQLELLVGTWDFTFQIGNFWIVKPVPNQNPIHFLVVGVECGSVTLLSLVL